MPLRLGPRDEPTWHDPTVLLRLVRELNCSSLPQVTTALGYATTAFKDLPVFRNFFAHRNEGTAAKTANVARRCTLSPALRPSEILCARRAGRPQSVLSEWLDDLHNVIVSVCR